MIVDVIGDILDLSEQVKQIQEANEDIVLNINSPGGYCFEGMHIINAIQKCPYNVTAHVSVEACSMAAVIAVACDKVEVEETSIFMFHNCMNLLFGNKEQIQPEVDAMGAIDNILHGVIQKHCTDPNFGERVDAGEVWLVAEDMGELFDNVEVVPVQKQEKKAAAFGNMAALVIAYNTLQAQNKAKAENPEEKEYTVPEDLKALLDRARKL